MISQLKFRLATCAVLAAVVVAASACDSGDPAPPFEVTGTGSLQGLLFFDANGDARFDPSSGDTVLKNVPLALFERGTTTQIGTGVTTDANGRFSITGVPVGTLALAIDTAGMGGQPAFCENPIPVTIFLNEAQFSNIAGRPGCVITITAAEQKPQGSSVTITGIVTATPGQISASSNYWYVQDATSGVELFGIALGGRTIALGDSVEVTGTLTTFQNELEISNGTLGRHVPNVRQVQPVTVTTRQAATPTSLSDPLLGQLIRLVKAQQTSGYTGGAGRNATLDDGTGPVTIRIESAILSDTAAIDTRFAVGKCYDAVGILRNFSTGPQFTPRSLNEVVEVPCT